MHSALDAELDKWGLMEREALVSVIGDELASAATVQQAVEEASKMLCWIALEVCRCARAVFQKRNVPDPSRQTDLSGGWETHFSVTNPFGRSPASMTICKAAKDMLVASAGDKEATHIASATMNLCNFNVTKPEDRLLASFGVLCTKRGVPCEASEVSAMIRDAASVYAVCMSEFRRFWGWGR